MNIFILFYILIQKGEKSECASMKCFFKGAGINGLCTAYQLAKRGAKVLLLEKVHV